MSPERLSQLFCLYIRRKASQEEEQEFMELAEDSSNRALLERVVDEYVLQKMEETSISEENSADILQAIFHAGKRYVLYPLPSPATFLLRRWRWAAASILVVMAFGYFWLKPAQQPELSQRQHVLDDIAPGREGAILTLADGTTILIDSLKNGTVTSQQGAKVVLKNGQLVYSKDGVKANAVTYNLMTTPKGRQFGLELTDGTKVWLNSASSIKYPTSFTEETRRVIITGEAYFEVARNTNRPFLVDVDGKSSIEVLGTQFNVNSYADEGKIKTTLIEGSVRISIPHSPSAAPSGKSDNHTASSMYESVVLRPGQQALTEEQKRIKVISDLDINQVVAWKNGFFDFNNVELSNMLRELERWYDIEIEYSGKPSPIKVKGKMYRDVNLSDVLEMLSKMGLFFDRNGRTIIIHGDRTT